MKLTLVAHQGFPFSSLMQVSNVCQYASEPPSQPAVSVLIQVRTTAGKIQGEFRSGPSVVKHFSDTGKSMKKPFRNKFGIINQSYAL